MSGGGEKTTLGHGSKLTLGLAASAFVGALAVVGWVGTVASSGSKAALEALTDLREKELKPILVKLEAQHDEQLVIGIQVKGMADAITSLAEKVDGRFGKVLELADTVGRLTERLDQTIRRVDAIEQRGK